MAKHIHTTYYEDNYVRYNCYECDKSFIIGEELSKGCSIRCPYCGSDEVDWEAMTDDDRIEELDMGCLGIYFDKIDLIARQLSIKSGGLYSTEQIKLSLAAIFNAFDTFQDSMKQLWDKLKPVAVELEHLLDKQIKMPKIKSKYQPYKTKLYTKKYYNKKVYYNCRNNC
ncbi:hypothetical protein [Clostridium sp. HMP27]|uniref:hypothetical protein n=1 Tax=Clostridium sp. HMP27 TaxID=1487921 RepID=UPI00052D1683|nr:hypothetical protein [Clostridium sp. HMP27]KGK88020.1 hypothetical protein DP68_08800 [Clostridium sp. HMP27]